MITMSHNPRYDKENTVQAIAGKEFKRIQLRYFTCRAAGHAAAAVAKMKSLQPWAYPKSLRVSQRSDAALV